MVHSSRARPRPCGRVYSLEPLRLHYGAYAMELCQPDTQTGRLLRTLLHHRTCALQEQSSQVGVTTFADTEQLLLAASGVFPRDYPHPGGELSTLGEGPPFPMAAMTAVAVTGPMPGMATSRWQASFS
jgi:hypothetical protein